MECATWEREGDLGNHTMASQEGGSTFWREAPNKNLDGKEKVQDNLTLESPRAYVLG